MQIVYGDKSAGLGMRAKTEFHAGFWIAKATGVSLGSAAWELESCEGNRLGSGYVTEVSRQAPDERVPAIIQAEVLAVMALVMVLVKFNTINAWDAEIAACQDWLAAIARGGRSG